MNVQRKLGFMDLFCLSSGAMISSGLFVLPGLAYADTGPSVFLTYFVASLLVIPAMLSKAELATAMPKSGGTYFYIDRSMGPGLGTLAGLSSWFSLSFKSAFALLGIGAFGVLIHPGLTAWQAKLIAAACCIVFTVINILSTKHAGRAQTAIVLMLLVILAFYVCVGLPHVDVNQFSPFMKADMRTFLGTAGLIFISYGGLTKIAGVAEEVRNPSRDIPLSMFASFLIVSALYVLAVLVTVGVAGKDLVRGGVASLTPLSDGAAVFMGAPGKVLLAFGAILAFVSTGNAGIMAASRAPLAMSRDDLLPKWFAEVHPRFETPVKSILATSAFMLAVIVFLELKMLVKTASTLMILLYALENLAVILMRESKLLSYRPSFRSPGYPWIQIGGTLAYAFLLYEMGPGPLLISGVFLGFGLLWYWFYGRIASNRVSALVRVVRRLTARDMRYDVLNSELREILLERDEIVEDRFDRILRGAPVLDLRGKRSVAELFDAISAVLADSVGLDRKEVTRLLFEREAESSTVLAPGLAVPHVIIPGEHRFELVLVRCRDGVSFPESEDPVKALFVLAGTRDERNFHLKALMCIAQVVQQDRFMEKWLRAAEEDELRDYVLLSERPRGT